MNRTNKALVFGLIAVGTGLAVKKLWSLATISDRVSFVISSLRVQKVIAPKNLLDIAGYAAQLAVGIKIYNPTNSVVNLKLPSVKVLYRGKEIAISTPDASITSIAANSANEKALTINIPLHTLTNNGISADINDTNKLSELLAKNLTFSIVANVNGVTISTVQSLNGSDLALSAGPREVKNGASYNKYFPKSDDQRARVVRNGEVDDVVNTAIAIVDKHHREAEHIAQVLKGSTVRETASNIFDFAYTYLQYRRDKAGIEELRTPARSWHDGQIRHKQMGIDQAGIDCDDYSIFCGSILKCLNIPFKFRITKYNGRSYFQHIYLYIPATANNPEIIIDPVLDQFDYEKPFSEQKDNFNMASLYAVEGLAGMPIETLSGLGNAEINELISGEMFLNGIDGFGDATEAVSAKSVLDSTLNYIIQTRNTIALNPQVMQSYTGDVNSLLKMFDDAIRVWNTPDRDRALEYIAKYEEALEKTGVFKPLQGINGELAGGFFKKVASVAKKVGNTALKVAKPLVATAATVLASSNPATMAFAPFAGKLVSKIVPTPAKRAATQAPASQQATQPVAQQAYVEPTASSLFNQGASQLKSSVQREVQNATIMRNSNQAAQRNAPTPLPAYLPANLSPVQRVVQNATIMNNSNIAAQKSASMPAASYAPSASSFTKTPERSDLPTTPAEEFMQSLVPAQQNIVEQQNQTSMSTENKSQEPGFFARNKKPLMIAGGALLIGTAAYLTFRKKRSDKPALPRSTGSSTTALAGLSMGRKKTAKKSTKATSGKTKAAKGKVSATKAKKTVTKAKKAAPKSKAPAKRKVTAKKQSTRRGVKRVTLR